MDTAVTDYLLSTTRAVRKRLDLDRPVEREVVLDCIRLSQQAPTGGNAENWAWLVVTDEDKRAGLAEIYHDASEDYFNTSGQADALTEGVRNSALYLRANFHRVPVHVLPLIQGPLNLIPAADTAGFYGGILPAAWSFMLALRSRGLGSSWTTLHMHQADRAAKLLGIPDDYVQVALLPVAYTIGTEFKPAKRHPVETIVHWNSWEG